MRGLRRLYFRENGLLPFSPPTASARNDRYVSDPAHPVPYRPRPIPSYVEWETWLVRDQRFVDNRPDVLTWQTPALTSDLTFGLKPPLPASRRGIGSPP